MTTKSLNEILDTLSEQAAKEISCQEPFQDIRAAFQGGQDIRELTMFHPNYNHKMGQIHPLFSGDRNDFILMIEDLSIQWLALVNRTNTLAQMNYAHESVVLTIECLVDHAKKNPEDVEGLVMAPAPSKYARP